MNSSIWCFIFSLIINVSITKDLHLKENILEKDKGGKTLMTLEGVTGTTGTKHDRFARHIETETQPNVLAIFLKKIGNVYPAMEQQRRGVFLNKVMRTLEKKITNQVATSQTTQLPANTTTSDEESSEEDDSD